MPGKKKYVGEPILYEEVFRALQKQKVKYLVAGGVAVNFHGFHRFTSDLDLMLHLDDKNLIGFVRVVKKLNFRSRVPIRLEDITDQKTRKEWRKNKNALGVSLDNSKNPIERIDIFLENPIDFDKAYAQRKVLTLRGVDIHLTNLKDLIALKKKTGRPVDKADIEILERINYRREKE